MLPGEPAQLEPEPPTSYCAGHLRRSLDLSDLTRFRVLLLSQIVVGFARPQSQRVESPLDFC